MNVFPEWTSSLGILIRNYNSRSREEACSGAGNKACREKMRRDRLNDRCVTDVTYLQLSICQLRSCNSVHFRIDESMKVCLILPKCSTRFYSIF